MFDRNKGFSFDLPASGAVQELIIIEGKLLAFCRDAIYEIQTAETIDPEKSDSTSRHTYKQLYSIGTKEPAVSWTIIQYHRVLESIHLKDHLNKSQIEKNIWDGTNQLIACYLVAKELSSEITKQLSYCDDLIEKHKHQAVIPGLPQINDLDKRVESFFINGKKALIQIFKIINQFYDRKVQDKAASHFDKAVDWLSDILGGCNPFVEMLSSDLIWIRQIAECRNAIEHPGEHFIVKVENFQMCPGNKFSPPSWRYDLTKKGLGDIDKSDLFTGINTLLANLVEFFEQVLLFCIKDNWSTDFPFVFVKNNHPDQDCPINFEISVDTSKLK